jgi:hypothetical protein
MALGSWTGIYGSVVVELMEDSKDQELLLLLAIAKHADAFGFCFPGRANLMKLRHCTQAVYERRLKLLVERCLVQVTEDYDIFRRQKVFIFQISPRVLYVREEVQAYCEAVFDGERQRDIRWELKFLEQHFSTNDSLPESLPESETRKQNPESVTRKRTRKHNQLSASEEGSRAGLHEEQRGSADQHRPVRQQKKDNPQAGAADNLDDLLSPTVDDDRLADEIRFAVATTSHQARDIVATFPRDGIVHWLRHTMIRRAKGELKNPGGYFYRMLKQHVPPNDPYDMP